MRSSASSIKSTAPGNINVVLHHNKPAPADASGGLGGWNSILRLPLKSIPLPLWDYV